MHRNGTFPYTVYHIIWLVNRIDEVDRLAKIALQEDPDIFDFDGTYDDFKRKEEHPLSSSSQQDAPKARYVQNLKLTAASKSITIE